MEAQWCEQLREAAETGRPLRLLGGGTRAFLCAEEAGQPLQLGGHSGIVEYQPTERVLVARAGTAIRALDAVLAAEGQCLGFDPPRFGSASTLGGAVALGMAGPGRPWTGAVRDFMLGVRMINGRGEVLNFGGRVMKNVAGYDIARLMVGARGTLGVLSEVSLKLLPLPECEDTRCLPMQRAAVLPCLVEWGRSSIPLSAAVWDETEAVLRVRLSGAEAAVRTAAAHIGGDADPDGAGYWQACRDLQHPCLCSNDPPLWRLSVPPAAPLPEAAPPLLLDWGGAQRWLHSGQRPAELHRLAATLGGHASTVYGGPSVALAPEQQRLQQRLKQAFDPAGILNPGACAHPTAS